MNISSTQLSKLLLEKIFLKKDNLLLIKEERDIYKNLQDSFQDNTIDKNKYFDIESTNRYQVFVGKLEYDFFIELIYSYNNIYTYDPGTYVTDPCHDHNTIEIKITIKSITFDYKNENDNVDMTLLTNTINEIYNKNFNSIF